MNVNLDDRKIDFTSYQGPVVLDTGLYIEFFDQTELGKFVKKNFIENDSINPILLHDLLLTEIYYITCRQLGEEKANEVLEVVKNIGTKIPTDQLIEIS